MSDFDVFWKAYPKRQAKGDARKAWTQTEKIRPPLAELLAAIEAQKQTEQWLKDGGQYIPLPATWLRAERWDDEVAVDMGPNVKNGKLWHETWPGIVAKGKELGLEEGKFDYPHQFKEAVMKAAQQELH